MRGARVNDEQASWLDVFHLHRRLLPAIYPSETEADGLPPLKHRRDLTCAPISWSRADRVLKPSSGCSVR